MALRMSTVQVEGDAKMLTNYINGSSSTQEDFKQKKENPRRLLKTSDR
jgi:hypothetical protein